MYFGGRFGGNLSDLELHFGTNFGTFPVLKGEK